MIRTSLFAIALPCAFAFGLPLIAADYSYSVSTGIQSIKLLNGSGEVQSTVVGPGLKSACPAGRFLITMDSIRPPQTGTVIGRDLNNPGTPDIQSTFDPDPDSTDGFFTNDDDIVTLSNGDVLMLWGYHSRAPLNPKPGWFDITFKGSFGPGVRRGTIVYRSKDCGQSFQYLTKIDPAKLDDGLCAYPQPINPPPVPLTYANGGSDGQLTKVDTHDNVYLSMGCGGFRQDMSKPGFVLSNNRVNRTYVLRSSNEGASWTKLGFLISFTGWRTGVGATPSGDLAFSALGANFLMFAHKSSGGQYTFSPTTHPAPVSTGWADNSNPVFAAINPNGSGGSRITAHTLVARVPGSAKTLIAFPATISDANNKALDGYQLFFYDPQTNQFAQADPVLPSVHAANHFLMHMVAIDPGSGPILLYWYDIDGNAKTATMRGRFIFEDGAYSKDFAVATDTTVSPKAPGQLIKVPHKFNVPARWYGDYLSAGGYAPHAIVLITDQQFNYAPMWVEGDASARYSHIIVDKAVKLTAGFSLPEKAVVYYPKWKPAPPPVEIEKALAATKGGIAGEPLSAERQQ
jgi:hypothetical protein